jgi:hypothetical protein
MIDELTVDVNECNAQIVLLLCMKCRNRCIVQQAKSLTNAHLGAQISCRHSVSPCDTRL